MALDKRTIKEINAGFNKESDELQQERSRNNKKKKKKKRK